MSSHSSFYQGTKRISPLKIRNPSILPSQIMPSPTGAPFNFAEMPWSYGMKPGQVMEFNAVIRPSPIAVPVGPSSPVLSIPSCSSLSPPTFGPPSPTPIIHSNAPLLPEVRKRKTDLDMTLPNLLPTKQFLTEEMMSSHLNNLHLSSEYTAHDINRSGDSTPGTSATLDDGDMMLSEDKSQQPYIVCMSPQELEERLKKAQRIAICEEVRKLDSRAAEILPKVILDRMEKPCTALMIWQPPQERLDKLFSTVTEQLEEREQQANKKEKESSSTTSLPTASTSSSAVATVPQWSMDDETLPDLPDYDEDLDDFEPQQSACGIGSQPAFAPDPATMDIEM
ncbi:uncharacterized protein LOC126581258 [Anopheles aquasalis]|uniref:uncharacterized protein LOC126581258 n=1 Tax=Anopheles aquasalis TaxID=42839 RepID=UPI00215B7068|nr:uncharacterized protein LOC126581258 [Anopheles aquasalis]